ncbi:complex I NDUFA9 subunit family protein [Paramagnetospirillum kuznetsovii]|uniref:Complex I NDUFA9 subunit family protein n=1 Tax=Paramagnetospirillum kuznetsovii TaxID=2053833 RepID=A0A364P1B7_9PROT|nr:complex I NDUFA9 subunit family protein [Paramagnetospirillum kuznetsovii]RAU23103.1 complex I NDUFA9 subunit family protein [Paramagnetospirillum kuznetsovii]
MARRVVTVFGGSGFIGRTLVRRLAAQGWVVRAAVRDPIAAEFLKPMGDVGQVTPLRADITDPKAVAAAVAGADAVVNLVGILYESGRRSFDAVHVKGAANVAAAAKAAGVARLVHMSALGADKNSESLYAQSKAAGEEAVLAAFPGATIFRPSVVFGPDDDFFNRFGKMAMISPVLPVFTGDGFKPVCTEHGCSIDLFGSGGPTFQPIHVGDVSGAIAKVLDDSRLAGKVYELGGPRRYSMKEIMELVLATTGQRSHLVPVPFGLGMLQATFLQMLPKPMLTKDQVRLMKVDNVVRGGKPGLADLGITPVAAETVLPLYMKRYGKHNQPDADAAA